MTLSVANEDYSRNVFKKNGKYHNTMAMRKGTKEQTIIYKTYKKIKNEKHGPTLKTGVDSGATEGYPVPAPLVAPVVLLLLKTR